MAGPERTELRISDPRALRALAHPARQRVVAELFSGEVLTATEAADLCGLTPSAMSYHLRALERWGIVERDESSDGRERPWRAAADAMTVTPGAHTAAGAAASRLSLDSWLDDLGAGLDRLAHAVAAGEEHAHVARGRAWLTDAEYDELTERLHEAFEPYRGRTRRDHPEGARPYDTYSIVLPTEPPAGDTAGADERGG